MLKPLAAILLCLAPLGLYTKADDDPYFRIYNVAGNVHMQQAPGAGGNIGVFNGVDGVLFIDDGYDRETPALLAAVSAFSDEEIRFLVNTHIHLD